MFGSMLTGANQGIGKGRVLVEKQVVAGRGPFWLLGALLVVRDPFGCQGAFWLSGAILVVRGHFGCQGAFWLSGAILVVRGRFLGASVNDYLVSGGFLHSLGFLNEPVSSETSALKSPDAGRLPKTHNKAFNTRKKV
jgi:hypothetical protein